MESYPAISVVLCTYNGGKYLASQIDSILAQTYPNFELIICDDVSVDHTVDILQQYAKKDRRIRIFLNKFNLGFNKNFEQALQLATGKWIAIADQDDVWVPQKLAVLYNLVDDHHWLIHSYNAEFKNDNIQESVINRSRVRFEGNEVAKLFFYNTITGHTVLIHKKLLEHAIPIPSHGFYDWWLGVQAAVYSSIRLENKVLVYYRQHEDNWSRFFNRNQTKKNKEAFFRERLAMLKSFLEIEGLKEADRKLLLEFIHLIETEWPKSFSIPVFLFFLRHSRTAFYFRKKKWMPWYYLKYSLQRGTLKIKHWV